jgi:hypothetical protein
MLQVGYGRDVTVEVRLEDALGPSHVAEDLALLRRGRSAGRVEPGKAAAEKVSVAQVQVTQSLLRCQEERVPEHHDPPRAIPCWNEVEV